MTYNVFGGTLNHTVLYYWGMVQIHTVDVLGCVPQ